MNFRITNVIISREYLTRVRKKSFLLTTFLGPIFFAALPNPSFVDTAMTTGF